MEKNFKDIDWPRWLPVPDYAEDGTPQAFQVGRSLAKARTLFTKPKDHDPNKFPDEFYEWEYLNDE